MAGPARGRVRNRHHVCRLRRDRSAERHIEEHEEAAERFFYIALAAALVSAAGLLQGGRGQAARAATLVAGLAVLAASVAVGHSGGELVYKHGAASAYTEPASISPSE